MNVIARPAVNNAIAKFPDAEDWLNVWWKTAYKSRWASLDEVRGIYPKADQVGSCLVFNVKGNQYRFIVGVRYATQDRGGTLFVKHFLTHAENNKDKWKKDCNFGD